MPAGWHGELLASAVALPLGTGSAPASAETRSCGEVTAPSCRRQPPPAAVVQPAEVVGGRYQTPFSADLVQAAEQELTEPHGLFDDPERRLHDVLSAGVDESSFLGPVLARHALAGGCAGRDATSGIWLVTVGVLDLRLTEVGVYPEFGGCDHVRLGSVAGVGADLVGEDVGVERGRDDHRHQMRVVGGLVADLAGHDDMVGCVVTAS